MAVRVEVGWAPKSFPILYHCNPRLTTHLPSTPDAWASSRCPTPIFRLVNAGPRTGKETNEVPFISESRLQDDLWAASFLQGGLMEPKPGSAGILRLPHQGIWGLEPFPQFPGSGERATQDACYSAYHQSLSETFSVDWV